MHYISRNRNYKPDWSQLTQFNSAWFDLTGLDLSQLKRTEPNRTIYRSPSSDGLPVGDHSTISKARSVDSCQLRVLQTCYICIHTYIYIFLYINVLVFACADNDLSAKTMIPLGIRNPQGLRTQTKAVCVCVNGLYIQYIFIYVMFVRLSLSTYCISTINRMCICNSLF